MRAELIRVTGLVKSFRHGAQQLDVLQQIDLSVHEGELLAVVGRSGAGKSTLLHILGGLEAPDAGQVLVDGEDIWALSETRRSQLRATRFGFVFQAQHLLPDFTALENVMLSARIAGMNEEAAEKDARLWLERFGLDARLDHHPAELSGGEKARAGLARALVSSPAILFADEPTGNLDRQQADRILADLHTVLGQSNHGMVVVTHDSELARRAHRVVELVDGRING